MVDFGITVIGGGIVGSAIAYQLSNRDGLRSFNLGKGVDGEIVQIEKNIRNDEGNQTAHNSCVNHAGIYYPLDSSPLSSKLCVKGNRMLYEFAERHSLPAKRIGKLVVATNNLEEDYLNNVYRISGENGVEGVEFIGGYSAKELEPNVECSSALWVPSSGIVDPICFLKKLNSLSDRGGVVISKGMEVVGIKSKDDGFDITIRPSIGMGNEEVFSTKYLINTAGLYADDIGRMVNEEFAYKITPVRGEIAKFYPSRKKGTNMNMHNVYPAPYAYDNQTGRELKVPLSEYRELIGSGKANWTVGVHLTPDETGSTVTIGPYKTPNVGKEEYSSNLRPAGEFLSRVSHYFPNLKREDIQLHQTGIMAVVEGTQDFVIEKDTKYPNCIHVIAPTPGLTASLAIAEYVCGLV